MASDLARRISRLSPEQKNQFELKLKQQGISIDIDISLIPITRQYRTKNRRFPLSSAQERLWFIHRLEPGNPAYNIIKSTELGNLDQKALKQSINEIIQRHEILRTVFITDLEKQEPAQVILPGLSVPLEIINLKRFAKETQNQKLKKIFQRESLYSFDLTTGPLLRVILVQLDEDKHILLINTHHIITDGISTRIFEKELVQLYVIFSRGRASASILPEVPFHYVDYACWEKHWFYRGSPFRKEQEKYWINEFNDKIPVLNIPIDYSRPKIQAFAGNSIDFYLGMNTTNALKEMAAKENATLYIVLVTIFYVLLSKLSGMEDIVIGTTVAGRCRAAWYQVMGMFANTLPLRNYPHQDKIFKDFLVEVKTRTLNAFENQEYQYEELVRKVLTLRDAGRNPLFDVMFELENINYYGTGSPGRQQGLVLKDYPYEKLTSVFDMTVIAAEEADKGLRFTWVYCTEIFKEETIKRFIGYFQRIVPLVVKNPRLRISEIDFIPGEEKRKILYDFNTTDAEYPRDKTIHELFAHQVEHTPDHVALAGVHETHKKHEKKYNMSYLSYKELNEQSNQLAHLLRQEGLKPDTIAGIMMEPSIEMMVGILAILKAGGAYLPIDPDYPQERINYMLKDSNARVLLTTSGLFEKFEKLFIVNCQLLIVNEMPPKSRRLNNSPKESNSINNYQLTIDNLQLEPFNLAYLIYTSGTTGKPKGVMIEHRNVIRLFFNDRFQFEFSHCDVWTLFHSFCFDFSVWEMYGALLYGGKLIVIPKMAARDTEWYKEILKEQQVTVLNQTPSAFYHLTDLEIKSPGKELNIRYIIFGGEALTPSRLKKWKEKYPGTKLINMYGITETTVHVTFKEIEDKDIQINISNIGKPLPTLTTYILDKYLKLVPVGVVGELFVGGEGVGRGYLNNPQLTAEKFDHDLWDLQDYRDEEKKVPGKRIYRSHMSHMSYLYRTGDLVKLSAQGDLEYRGRIDSQVKIRGYRIELREIQQCLLEKPGIKQAVVLARENKHQEKYLCAYIVSSIEFEVSQLRQYLSGVLPAYMIPSYFMQLERIPLTVNGKIDVESLPLPGMKAAGEYAPPRDYLEKKLVEIWTGVLFKEGPVPPAPGSELLIGIDDNFFERGGHSLNATTMVSRIHKELKVKLPLVKVFTTPFIRGLAASLRKAAGHKYAPVEPIEKKDYYQLSSAQERLYILQKMEPGSTAYNMPQGIPPAEDLDIEKLQETFIKLIKRHESLRTSFHLVNDKPVQKAHEDIEFEIEYYDLKNPKSEIRNSKQIQNSNVQNSKKKPASSHHSSFIIHHSFIRPFDLSRTPLLRVGWLNRGNGRQLLLIDMHHIISDGISQQILARDFTALYNGEELPSLRLHYKDFPGWQNSENQKEIIKQQENYWLKEFAGEIPVLNLPTDFKRPMTQRFEGDNVIFGIPPENISGLKTIASGSGATIFMVLLTIYTVFLSKLSGQENIIVGTPVAGRRHADLENIIGMFVNTLPLRNFPIGEKTFRELLEEVKQRTLDAFDNQDYPFDHLVDRLAVHRDTGRNPLFDIMFSLQQIEAAPMDNILDPGPHPGKRPSPRTEGFQIATTKFDLTLTAVESGKDLYFDLSYHTSLFSKATCQRFAAYFKETISSITEAPGKKLYQIEILPARERNRLLYEFNEIKTANPPDKTILGLFRQQVRQTPHGVSLVWENEERGYRQETVTYRELANKADQLAGLLKAKGLKAGKIAAVTAERSLEMVIALLGILTTGAAYLPIDPNTPDQRLRYILADSEAQILVTTPGLSEKFKKLSIVNCQLLMVNEKPPVRRRLNNPPKEANLINNYQLTINNLQLKGKSLAYVIYTSGTTGNPKGVLLDNKNLVNYINWVIHAIEITGEDRSAYTASFAFDAVYTQLYGALLRGAQFHIISRETNLSSTRFLDYIQKNRLTFLKMTPSLFSVIFNDPGFSADRCQGLRFIMLGGEQIIVKDVDAFHLRCHHVRIMNHYGPTEATIGSCARYIDFNRFQEYKNHPTIGRSIDNTRVYILDRYMQLVPMGISGDFYIAGAGLARGYLNQPELTANRFKPGGFFNNDRLYRTGDIARFRPDGTIELLGRLDNQVKIRGFRIELKEIENRLLNYSPIKEALVTAREDKAGNKYLCAYIVPGKEETVPAVIDGLVLRKHLEKELPGYMIPNYFVQLEEIPLTRHNKIDYQRLPEPGPAVVAGQIHEPRSRVEEKLAHIWADVLETERETISWGANFFQGGGHSLKAITLISKIHKELKVKIPLREFFNTPTLRGISTYIKGAAPEIFVAVQPVEKKEYYALSPAQVRMYAIQQLDKKSTAYNMSFVVSLEGEAEIEKLRNTFKKLIARHESFRTCFEIVHEEPMQRVHEMVEFEIEFCRSVSSPAGIGTIIREFIRPFDLSQAPLLRVGLIKEEAKKHILVVNIHHIIGDALSQGILVRDLISMYRDEGNRLPPLRLRYIDYSKWLTGKVVTDTLKKQEDYWLQVFASEFPVLNLPTDNPEQEIQSFAGDSVEFATGEEEMRLIKQCALEEGVTLQILLLAIFYILLSKLGGQEDMIIGTPAAGRRHPDLAGIIGLFINTLALRNFPSGKKTFREFLKEVKENSLEAYENQDYPFDQLVEKISHKNNHRHRSPLFNVMFELRKREIHLQEQMDDNPGLKINPREIDIKTTIMDIDWVGIEMNNRLLFRVGYRTRLFKRERIERMTKRYREILKQVLANREIKLTDIVVSHDYAAAQSAVSRIDHGGFEF